MEMIIRASQNQAFVQIINEINGKVCRLDKALVNELDENATAQESALTAMADMLSRSKGDVTIYTGENSRIRYLQIAKYLKNGSDTADIADEIQSKFTATMRKLTVGEANAITALAEAIADAMAEERKIVVRNTRQLLHVQLTGDLDELESLVGKLGVYPAAGRWASAYYWASMADTGKPVTTPSSKFWPRRVAYIPPKLGYILPPEKCSH